ncbi:MAG: hypothetical protein U0N82_04930 [Oscillospiraceae bacterium]
MKKLIKGIIVLTTIFALSIVTSASTVDLVDDTLPGNATSVREMFEYAVCEAAVSPAVISANSGNMFSTTLENAAGALYDVQMFEYTPATEVTETEVSRTFVFSANEDFIVPRSSHSQTNDGWDSSISVYGYLTVRYSLNNYNGTDKYLLTNVSGGWEREDSSVSIVDRYVGYTCQSVFDNSQITYNYPSSNSFNYPTGYTTYVYDDNLSAVVGAVSIADLVHGTSEWQLITRCFILENDLADLIDTKK